MAIRQLRSQTIEHPRQSRVVAGVFGAVSGHCRDARVNAVGLEGAGGADQGGIPVCERNIGVGRSDLTQHLVVLRDAGEAGVDGDQHDHPVGSQRSDDTFDLIALHTGIRAKGQDHRTAHA